MDALDQISEIVRKLMADDVAENMPAYQSPEELLEQLDLEIKEEGTQEKDFYALLGEVAQATPRTAHRNFFNQLFGGRNIPAMQGEILAAVLNNSMYTFKVAGPQVLVEQEVIRKMLEKISYEEGEGAFTPGGSMSNMLAMLLARDAYQGSIRNEGLPGEKLIAYTSEDSHYSTRKNAGILGIGRDQVRFVPCDARGRMDVQALAQMIRLDREQGGVPFFINATAGTTVLGAFDPFREIGQIAQSEKIWFHIDGAFGGSAILSPKYRHHLDGCELSDSFTWNAHKMMNVPLTASILLIQGPRRLRRLLSEKAEYLFQGEEDFNPGETSLQCGRRNDALKVWASWKFWGDAGYARRIEKQYALAAYAVQKVKEDPSLELIQEPDCVTVCFEVLGHSAVDICTQLNQMGLAKVGYGKARAKTFVRMVCVDPDMQEQDLDQFFEKLRKVRDVSARSLSN